MVSRLIGDTTVTGAIASAMKKNICETQTMTPENVNHLAASGLTAMAWRSWPGHSSTSAITAVAAR
jgi:hypothetical protein